MERLNFPGYDFRITKNKEGKQLIFDEFRRKELVLTPEEWVRQHLLQYLARDKHYPASLISSEAGIKVNTLSRRYDALIYDRSGTAVMLIECKSPQVTINQKVFDQVAAYNQTIRAKYILVSNGLRHYCCKSDPEKGGFNFLKDIPEFEAL